MDWIQPESDRPDSSRNFCAGLSAGHAPDDWGTLGIADHAAHRDFGAAGLRRIRIDWYGSTQKPERNPESSLLSRLPNDTIVANCFLSLRLLSATDWKDFFEQTSRVEQILRNDPAQIYADMDFDTRNNYRSVIEELARHSKFSEEQVALAAVEFARNVEDKVSTRKTHVGFYLIDAGRATLENSISYKPGIRVRMRRALLAFPTATYLGSIAILSMLFVLGLLTYATLSGGSLAQLIVVGLLGLGLALEAAITIVHWNVTHRIKPQSLPRMDFSEGIPAGNRTMVVVPTLLESAERT